MPIFDFKCNACGHTQEEIISLGMQDFTPAACPKCGGIMEKQFSLGKVNFDVVGGYDYQHGKKSYTKLPPEKRTEFLVKDAAGKYKNPY